MLICLDSPVDHCGAPVIEEHGVFHVVARWGHDEGVQPVTRIIAVNSDDGSLVWKGTRPDHLAPASVLAVVRLHLPPAPEWADFGRHESDALADATSGVVLDRPARPGHGFEMQFQREALGGTRELARTLSPARLGVEDRLAERARALALQEFKSGGIEAVEMLGDDLTRRAYIALCSLTADPMPGGLTLLTRHLRVQAERLIAKYDAA